MNNKFNEYIYGRKMPIIREDKVRLKFILNKIKDCKQKILDIGCWDGTYSILFKKNTNTVYGIESSKSAAKLALKKKIKVINGDFMKINCFTDEFFDIVIAGEIVEHIFDTDKFIRRIYRILKPGGLLLLTTPNVASLPRRIMLLFGINPFLENRIIKNESVGHIRYFTFKDLHELIKENKFKILNSESDVLKFNNSGTYYSSVIPKICKYIGKTILVCAKKT